MYPPPPIPQDCGRAALSANTVVTAASIALPPFASTARPARAAAGDSVATTPAVDVTPSWYRDPWTAPATEGESEPRTQARKATTNQREDDMHPRYPSGRRPQPARSVAHRPGERLDEVLELLGGPALVGLAVLLV